MRRKSLSRIGKPWWSSFQFQKCIAISFCCCHPAHELAFKWRPQIRLSNNLDLLNDWPRTSPQILLILPALSQPTDCGGRRGRGRHRSAACRPRRLGPRIFFFCKISAKFARFRLYRRRSSQVNTRFTAVFKIYQIIWLKFLKFGKICKLCNISVHLQKMLLNFHENCWFFKPIVC